MIKEALNLLKSGYIDEKGKVVQKKPVLIIEDLDRLDPAHLFRILNVISAHIDDVMKPDKIGNKFGFSNIVIVMDYDTTKHIFEHFYGKNASYEGYMSKFLVEEPFKYSIIELAIAKLKTKLSEEIGIDILFTNSLSILNLKIASFSMRDIVRIYDFDVHHRIKQNKYEINDKLCLSTSLPIFKLILYMIEFGMSIGDIQEDLSYHIGYNVKEYLKLVFPLYAMEKKKKNKVFDLETDLIQAKLEFSEDLATSVSVGYPEYQTGSAPSFSKEMRLSVINDILCMNRHIDIASLNVNVGFTIPNYKSLI